MSLPVVWDLSAYRGDTWSQSFRLLRGGQPLDLSGATVESEARAKDGTKTPLVVSVEDAADGRINVSLPEAFLPFGNYRYDVEVAENGSVTTWVRGALKVERDVTNEPA